MKALRVFKWISFIVFILALCLCVTAHSFILADMNICNEDKADDVLMTQIFGALEKENGIDLLLGKTDKKDDAAEEPTVDDTTVTDETHVPEDNADTPETSEPVQETETEIVPEQTAPATGESSSGSTGTNEYSLEGKNRFVKAVMRLGTQKVNIKFVAKLVGTEDMEISISMLVAFCALFIAFVMHFVSKKYKTVYGMILMLFGYLFFAAIFVAGYIAFSHLEGFLNFSESAKNDWAFMRTITITGFFALATLIGLPIYSCGIRQMTIKRLKKRLVRKSNHK
ncbi:MAG: hypothetical protein IJC48_01635 [Clostridia bacterium]|nr:hypothetical protein [Clostridia bacterium]